MGGAVAVCDLRARRRQDHHARSGRCSAGRTMTHWRAILISGRFTSTTALHADPLDQRRTRILFYLFVNVDGKKHGDRRGKAARGHVAAVHLAPRFQWQQPAANSRAGRTGRCPDNRGIERNWSPLWSFWRSENNPQTGARSQSLLWNLYRRDSTPGIEKMLAPVRSFPVSIRCGNAKSCACFTFRWSNVIPTGRPAGKMKMCPNYV